MVGGKRWAYLYIQEMKCAVLKGSKEKVNPNLTKAERGALTEFIKNHRIVIRPADKGSGVEVTDTDEYVFSILKRRLVGMDHAEGQTEMA